MSEVYVGCWVPPFASTPARPHVRRLTVALLQLSMRAVRVRLYEGQSASKTSGGGGALGKEDTAIEGIGFINAERSMKHLFNSAVAALVNMVYVPKCFPSPAAYLGSNKLF